MCECVRAYVCVYVYFLLRAAFFAPRDIFFAPTCWELPLSIRDGSGTALACPVALMCWNSLFRDGRHSMHTLHRHSPACVGAPPQKERLSLLEGTTTPLHFPWAHQALTRGFPEPADMSPFFPFFFRFVAALLPPPLEDSFSLSSASSSPCSG